MIFPRIPRKNENQGEDQAGSCEMAEICADTDMCEKHWREDHVTADDYLTVYKGSIVQTTEHQAGHVCACDGGDVENLFCKVGV